MRIIHKDEDYWWTLWDHENDLFLEVACGGVGVYTVVVKLSVAEKQRFTEDGLPFIGTLARSIAKNESKYSDQMVQGFHDWPGAEEAHKAWQANKHSSAN